MVCRTPSAPMLRKRRKLVSVLMPISLSLSEPTGFKRSPGGTCQGVRYRKDIFNGYISLAAFD